MFACLLIPLLFNESCKVPSPDVPYWLKDYADIYKKDPEKAARSWFSEAKSGMFIHFNLASLCEYGRDDYQDWSWGKASDRLLKFVGYTRSEYDSAVNKDSLLFLKFSISNFDTEKICRLAVKAKMKYITFTTIHAGGCYNFKTGTTDFNSLNAPCHRDLVADLKKSCEKYNLALFFYVPPDIVKTRPAILKRNQTILRELLTQYGPVAGMWFDGINGFYQHPEDYEKTDSTYLLVRTLQPHCLISFKEGANCDEDFISPEHFMLPFDYSFDTPERLEQWNIHKGRWMKNSAGRWENCFQYKLREICTVMQKCKGRDFTDIGGGWINDERAEHLTADEVYYWLKYSQFTGSNMLMNIGLRADGSIHPDDIKSLEGLGKIIEEKGWPETIHKVPVEN